MNIDKTKISSTKFMFTIACFIQSTALVTSVITSVTKHESWIIPIISGIAYIPLILVFKTLMQKFPNKTLLGMLNEVFGKFIGKTLGTIYVISFLTLTALNLNDLGHFSKITLMRETPHIVLMIICMLVVVYTVRSGAKVVTRYGAIFSITHILIVIVTFALLASQMNVDELLPVFDLPPIRYLQASHLFLTIPTGEAFALLMLTPYVNIDSNKLTKAWILGAGIGVTTLFIVFVRDVLTLGNILHLFSLPGFVSMRLISLGEALSRIEILFSVLLIMLLFFKISIYTFISTTAISELLGIKEYKNIAFIVGTFIVFYVPFLYPNETEHRILLQAVSPFLWTPLYIITPVFMLTVTKIKEKLKNNKSNIPEVIKAWDGS